MASRCTPPRRISRSSIERGRLFTPDLPSGKGEIVQARVATLVGVEPIGWLSRRARSRGGAASVRSHRQHCPSACPADQGLVGHAIEAVGPDMGAGRPVDQLAGDAHAVACARCLRARNALAGQYQVHQEQSIDRQHDNRARDRQSAHDRRICQPPHHPGAAGKQHQGNQRHGRTKLSATWLTTSACVASLTQAATITVGTIVISRRSQSGMRQSTKSCMII